APDAELAANRGTTAGYNPVTELSADPHRISVNPRAVIPPIDDQLVFLLEELQLVPPENCEDFGGNVGYRLVKVAVTPGASAELLHEDKSIPSSRRCPLGYRIGAVQTFFPQSGEPVFAVVIAVRS